jgi:hypothetical protein
LKFLCLGPLQTYHSNLQSDPSLITLFCSLGMIGISEKWRSGLVARVPLGRKRATLGLTVRDSDWVCASPTFL